MYINVYVNVYINMYICVRLFIPGISFYTKVVVSVSPGRHFCPRAIVKITQKHINLKTIKSKFIKTK